MPITGLHHVDLAVRDVGRSLAFYLRILGPLGLREAERTASYRGTEEVVYLHAGRQMLGLRRADGGEHHYYDVGIEHLAFFVERPEEVDETYERCLQHQVTIHFPPQAGRDHPGYWAVFFFDPDGFRVEVAHWTASRLTP
jgi:catechol 2,3-dioxygenase-like lactoylglutathione lyase family enzyme